MKKLLFFALIFINFSVSAQPADIIPENQECRIMFRRGVNMSYWVSQRELWKEGEKLRFSEKDLEFVAGLGFDHIRLPVDEMILFDKDLNKRQYTFDEVHKIISTSLNLGLNVIVDLHTIYAHLFNGPESSNPLFTDKEAQKRLYRMWTILSEECRRYPTDRVAYEILNEPATVIGIDGATKEEATAVWNRIQEKCYRMLRKAEPERVILLTADQWQRWDMIRYMFIPKNDRNVILTMHYYEPMQLTHFRISFNQVSKYKGLIHYPGPLLSLEELEGETEEVKRMARGWDKEVYNRERINFEISEAFTVAREHNLPLYCSEFGVTDNVPLEFRRAWFCDVTDAFEKRAVGYASWEYVGTWGILSESWQPRDYMYRYLTKKDL